METTAKVMKPSDNGMIERVLPRVDPVLDKPAHSIWRMQGKERLRQLRKQNGSGTLLAGMTVDGEKAAGRDRNRP